MTSVLKPSVVSCAATASAASRVGKARKKSRSCGLKGSEPRLRSWSMSRASQESFLRWRSLLRFCQIRHTAMTPPMMANTYIQLVEPNMSLLVFGDGDFQPRQSLRNFDLAGEPGIFAIVRELGQQIALI